MFTKHLLSALAISSVLIVPGVARAQSSARNLSVLRQTTPNYSVEIKGSQSRICVKGKCSYSYNCPTLSASTLTRQILGIALGPQTTRVLCQTQQPLPSRVTGTPVPRTTLPSQTTRTVQSQTITSGSGVTQINQAQTTMRSN